MTPSFSRGHVGSVIEECPCNLAKNNYLDQKV